MSQDNVKKDSKDDVAFGIGLAFAFICLAIYFYFTPKYLGNDVASLILSGILMIIGIVALGLELNKLNNGEKSLGLDNLGIGVGLFIVWALLHYYFPMIWVNWVLIPVLFLGVAAMGIGIATLIENVFSSDSKKMQP
ncbi:hypothetical protein ABEX38_21930 [Priestia megaterium]